MVKKYGLQGIVHTGIKVHGFDEEWQLSVRMAINVLVLYIFQYV